VSLAHRRVRHEGPVRGRPRSEAVERSIIEGVMKLLEDGVPLTEVSIERVARTAGVGKATIYRRWSGKEELFVDVLRAAEPADPELPGTSMRDDLVVLLESLRQRGLSPARRPSCTTSTPR
jgi:AcrR family transcriptional regulator